MTGQAQGGLVSQGLHLKIPQTGWLRQQKFIFSQFGGQKFETEVSAGLGWGGLWACSGPRSWIPVASSVPRLTDGVLSASSVVLPLCSQFPFLKIPGKRDRLDHLQRPYFQIGSQSKVLGIRTSTSFWDRLNPQHRENCWVSGVEINPPRLQPGRKLKCVAALLLPGLPEAASSTLQGRGCPSAGPCPHM